MSASGGKLVRIGVRGEEEVHEVPKGTHTYEKLRELVGGYIERIQVRYEGKLRDAYVDEDGLSKGLVINPRIMNMLDGRFKGYPGVIVGPAVIWVPTPKKKVVS